MTYSTRRCPIERNDYETEVEFFAACEEYLDSLRELGYRIVSTPNASGYFHVDKIEDGS